MRHYWIEIFDRVTGQTIHRSDFFDNSEDALQWAKDELPPVDASPEVSWRLAEEAGDNY